MWYLISVYWLWLTAAFFLGLLIGVLAKPCAGSEMRSGKFFYLLILLVFLVVFVLLYQLVRGEGGHWYEMAAFMTFVLFCGLAVGCLFADEDSGSVEQAAIPVVASEHRIEPSVAVPSPSQPQTVAAFDQPPASPALANEADFDGVRPAGFVSARNDKADDLKLISGIGKQNEGRLHGLGIWHFDQIAGWTPDNVLWVGSYLSFPGRIDREKWIEQAKALAAGEVTEFAKRAAAGKVATSRDDGDKGSDNIEKVPAKRAPRGKKPDTA